MPAGAVLNAYVKGRRRLWFEVASFVSQVAGGGSASPEVPVAQATITCVVCLCVSSVFLD